MVSAVRSTTTPVSLTELVLRLPRICYLVLKRQEVVVDPKSCYTDRVQLQIVAEVPTTNRDKRLG